MSSHKCADDEEVASRDAKATHATHAKHSGATRKVARPHAGHTHTLNTDHLRPGHYMMLQGEPCKVTRLSRVVPSKHGRATIHIVGVNVFSGARVTGKTPGGGSSVDSPVVTETTYVLLDVNPRTGVMSLLNGDTGDVRDDVAIPTRSDVALELERLMASRRAASTSTSGSVNNPEEEEEDEEGRNADEEVERCDALVTVTVLEAMGRAVVSEVKLGR